MLRIRHNACPACGDGDLARVDLGVIQRLDMALAEVGNPKMPGIQIEIPK